ncbi:MAG: hypothetical protein KatS3mg024_0134 [Armatimonadota bacterium]|nr:MAG: hypothetical protein KatS3mg024_0134 [Armatimonadota bacterium]
MQSGQAHTCASCGGEIHGDPSYCPSCGAVAPEVGGDGGKEGVDKQLAAANLARIRKQWEEATRLCLQALAADPDNASAHALLGDIYHDQNRVEEAAVWYQMALDLEPANASLRAKLEREKAVLKARGAKPSTPPPDDSADSESRLDKFVRGEGYRSLVNIITMVLGGLVLIVLIALVIRQLSGDGAVEPTDTSPAPYAATPQQGRSTQSGGTAQQPPVPYTPPRTESPAAPRPQQTQSSTFPLPPGTARPEQGFLERLRGQNDIWLGGRPDAAWADPRIQSVTITVTWQGAATSADRVRILRQAKEVARAAFAVEPQAALVTVRVLADLPDFTGASTSRQVAFVGDITPSEANRGMDENADVDTWERLFSRVHWHPSLRGGAVPSR